MNYKEKFTYQFLKLISRHLNKIDEKRRILYTNVVAGFVYKFIPVRKRVALNNIQTAFPNQDNEWAKEILKNSYRIAIKNFIEFLSIPVSVKTSNFKIKNVEVLKDALDQKRGVILVTGHYGLWEKWGAWLGMNGYQLSGIIQKQSNKGSDLFFREIRESYGMSQIYKRSPLNEVYSLLKKNKILILASDQDAKHKGVIVNFFGKKTSVPKGAAIFHLKTKAALVFSVATLDSNGDMTIIFESLDIEKKPTIQSITQTYTKMLEKMISKNPDHYFWFHNKWKTVYK
jgi:KDO2-lipid IV(A) lauroyltransferase